ncbi:hypothetical protein TRAPUB_7026 [Trametes pubescens]|uniref:Uncharacterized protein n=1 Tax=Trametes pubescens TaxID=154538 RepID=A0A1M2V4B0_TRAPU|nr:hypothetical protein TRAPUB_7026 [Trametes pubescens]
MSDTFFTKIGGEIAERKRKVGRLGRRRWSTYLASSVDCQDVAFVVSASSRPLPDERPRQSVANLIGRFEQQHKRNPGAAAAANQPRASSVASQHTGDSAKEELKEKREWPPKPKPTPTSTPSNVFEIRREQTSKSPEPAVAPTPLVIPASSPPAPAAQPIEPAADPVSPVTPVNSDKHVSPVSPSPPKKKVAATPSKPASGRSSAIGARPPVTPSKNREGRPSTAGAKPTTRTPVKSPPPSSFHSARSTSSVPQPKATPSAKPAPASRSRPTSRASGPITPARAKTPSAARPKTPSASRPKTPSATPKPKLPSSGLYAPTAASLARARNAEAAAAAPPVRKPTASKETLDRLIKPTAASISKVRQPTLPTASKATPTKSGIPAPKGAAAKPRASAVGTAAKAKAAGGAAVSAAKVAAKSEPEHHDEEPEVIHDEPEHHEYEESGSTLVDEPAISHEPEEIEHEEVAVEEHGHAEEQPEEEVLVAEEHHEEPALEEVEHHTEHDEVSVHSEEAPAAEEELHVEAEDTTPEALDTNEIPATSDSEADAVHSEGETHVDTESDTVSGSVVADKSGGDIEDIVGMLEGPILVSKERPVSVIVPDVAEIPDIED